MNARLQHLNRGLPFLRIEAIFGFVSTARFFRPMFRVLKIDGAKKKQQGMHGEFIMFIMMVIIGEEQKMIVLRLLESRGATGLDVNPKEMLVKAEFNDEFEQENVSL